eukprot:SAG22_NODE_4_length_44774_cov_362.122149_11_plen_110_part_00
MKPGAGLRPPADKGERLLLFPDVVMLSSDLTAPPGDSLGGFADDWPPAKLQAVAPRLAALNTAAAVRRTDLPASKAAATAVSTTFQELEASAARQCVVLGLEEGAEIAL